MTEENTTKNATHEGKEEKEEKEGCEGEGQLTPANGAAFWTAVGLTLLCVCSAATAAGLTLGLLSVDKLQLDILCSPEATDWQDRSKWGSTDPEKAAEMAEQQVYARRIYPLVMPRSQENCFANEPHHLLMVTLLLMNALANEALPLFLDKLMPSPIVAVLVSVSVVLIVGEIIPTALFTGESQLMLAAKFSPVVYMCKTFFAPIAWPIAWILDNTLGEEHENRFNRAELRTLIKIHSREAMMASMGSPASARGHTDIDDLTEISEALKNDEVIMVKGVLELRDELAQKHMTPINETRMISTEALLNEGTLAEVLSWGHSRLPVYDKTPDNIRGIILVKRLICLDPKECRMVSTLEGAWRHPIFIPPSINLQDLLNKFQQQKLHIALVSSDPAACRKAWKDGKPLPAGAVSGLITIEDVLEFLIQESIEDETDHVNSVQTKLAEAFTLQRRLPKLRKLVAQERKLRTIENHAELHSHMKGWGRVRSIHAPDSQEFQELNVVASTTTDEAPLLRSVQ